MKFEGTSNYISTDDLNIAVNAAKLYKQIHKYDESDGEVDFPHWWQSKIVKAQNYLDGARNYLDAELNSPRGDMPQLVI